MVFRKARTWELDQVRNLYLAARDDPFCAWDEEYPGIREILADNQAGMLYVLADGDQLAGALSIVPVNELDSFSCWKSRTGKERELARITVAKEYRGRGLAAYMVTSAFSILHELNCPAVHLSAAKDNIPAVRTYQRLGFSCVGEEAMYGGRYYLFERII